MTKGSVDEFCMKLAKVLDPNNFCLKLMPSVPSTKTLFTMDNIWDLNLDEVIFVANSNETRHYFIHIDDITGFYDSNGIICNPYNHQPFFEDISHQLRSADAKAKIAKIQADIALNSRAAWMSRTTLNQLKILVNSYGDAHNYPAEMTKAETAFAKFQDYLTTISDHERSALNWIVFNFRTGNRDYKEMPIGIYVDKINRQEICITHWVKPSLKQFIKMMETRMNSDLALADVHIWHVRHESKYASCLLTSMRKVQTKENKSISYGKASRYHHFMEKLNLSLAPLYPKAKPAEEKEGKKDKQEEKEHKKLTVHKNTESLAPTLESSQPTIADPKILSECLTQMQAQLREMQADELNQFHGLGSGVRKFFSANQSRSHGIVLEIYHMTLQQIMRDFKLTLPTFKYQELPKAFFDQSWQMEKPLTPSMNIVDTIAVLLRPLERRCAEVKAKSATKSSSL